jgi:hypothetical protein
MTPLPRAPWSSLLYGSWECEWADLTGSDDPGSSGERMQQDSSTVQDVEKLWAKHTLIPHSDECTPQAEAVYWRAGPR